MTSGEHAGEASAMARWKTAAGIRSEERRKKFREVKKMRADELKVSPCQVKGNLKLKFPEHSYI